MSNARGNTIPNFKLYYTTITIKTAMILAQKQTEKKKTNGSE
jgi:hypothetical protein